MTDSNFKSELIAAIQLMDQQLESWDNNKLGLYRPHDGRGGFDINSDNGQIGFHKSDAQIRMLVTGNRGGKSECVVMETAWLALGIHPYHKIPVPNKGKLYGESFPVIMETLWPKFEKWIPKSALAAKRPLVYNQMGHLIGINWANGSVTKIGSYDQEVGKAEGSDWDYIGFDEPPPRDLYIANFRGIVDRGGKMFFSMTPLKEPWIYDELWTPGITGKKKYIRCFNWSSYANPYINKSMLDVFSSELTEDERAVRIEGLFKKLQGLVIKTYDSEYSDIDPFVLNDRYVIYEGIDPHTSKPNCALWKAIDDEGYRYVVSELSFDGGIYDFGQAIAERRRELEYHGARVVKSVSDTSINQKDMMLKINMYDELKRSLREAGETLMPSLVNKRNSIDPGIKRLIDLYRLIDRGGWKSPTQYVVAEDCPKYKYELLHYQWPDNLDKDHPVPMKKNDEYLDCLSSDLQILTYDGWKYYNEMNYNDLIASVNLDSFKIEYHAPNKIIIKNYLGEMIYLNNRLSVCVTPNHRMVVYNHPSGQGLKICLSKDLKPTYQIPLSVQWEGDDSNEFILPAVKKRRGVSGDIKFDKSIFFEFLGWYVSEGFLGTPSFPGHGWQIGITQNDGWKKEKILNCMKRLGFSVSKITNGYSFSNKQLWKWIYDNCGRYSHGKKIPQIVKDSSPRFQKIFWDAAILGDGWKNRGREVYSTVSLKLCEDMQEILLKMGHSTSIFIKKPKDTVIRGKKVAKENCRILYCIFKNTKKRISLSNRKDKKSILCINKIFYDGIVWCVSVPTGAFIARNPKNGMCFVIGNCDRYIETVAPSFTTRAQSQVIKTYNGAYSPRRV